MLEAECPDTFSDACIRHSPPPNIPSSHKLSTDEALALLDAGSIDPSQLAIDVVLQLAAYQIKYPVQRTDQNAKLLDHLADQLFGQPALV